MSDDQANEVNDVSPSSLTHLVGQRQVIAQVQVALDACFEDGLTFPSSLLVGPPGSGKSQTARVIYQELAADFHEVLGQSICGLADLNALMLGARHCVVVHIDEAYQLG